MDKLALRKIPRPGPRPDFADIANADIVIRWIAACEKVEDILQITFYWANDLRNGKYTPVCRLFCEKDDYITQNLELEKAKWLTGRIVNILEIPYWSHKFYDYVKFGDEESLHQASEWFCKKNEGEILDALWDWQEKIVEKRLKMRHEKELLETDRDMGLVPELPEKFRKWTHDEGLYKARWLIYDYAKGKRLRPAYCTHCGKESTIDSKKVVLQNNEKGICPVCGTEATLKAKGKMPFSVENRSWVSIIQKTTDGSGFVVRYFSSGIRFRRDDRKEEFWSLELCRTIFKNGAQPKHYEYRVYKQQGKDRWCPDGDKFNCSKAVLYTKNLPGELNETDYRYSAIEILQRKMGHDEIPLYYYLANFQRARYLEYFVKMGLTNLVKEVATLYGSPTIRSGNTPKEILGIGKSSIRKLVEINGGPSEIRLLRQCEADAVDASVDEITKLVKLGINDETVGLVNTHCTLNKFLNWLEKQMELSGHGSINICRDWKDYVSWLAKLGYDTTDLYYFLPPDFRKAHDRIHEEYMHHLDKIRKKERAELDKLIRENMNKLTGSGFEMETKKFLIKLPANGSEIRKEGSTLHHCVGSYVDKVAKGQTIILFVRKKENPDTPFYTMEWKNNHVEQCRGERNCKMTQEVEAFVTAFEKTMQGRTEKQKKAG